MSRPAITHRTWDRRAVFHERGVSIGPWLASGMQLGWDEIEFVCVTPRMVRDDDGWCEKPIPCVPPGFRSTFATRGELELRFAVRDRRPVVARAGGWWNRAWVGSSLRGMLDAEERVRPDRSVVRQPIRCTALDRPLGELLDLLEAHCRFDLLVTDF